MHVFFGKHPAMQALFEIQQSANTDFLSKLEVLSNPYINDDEKQVLIKELAAIIDISISKTRPLLQELFNQSRRVLPANSSPFIPELEGFRVTVAYNNDFEGIAVTMPLIIAVNTDRYAHYLPAKVRAAMVDFEWKNHANKNFTTHQKVYVVFIHCGPMDVLTQSRDYDNVEKSAVLNALQITNLFSDNPNWCSVLETTKVSEETCTIAHIVPEDKIIEFLSKHLPAQRKETEQ